MCYSINHSNSKSYRKLELEDEAFNQYRAYLVTEHCIWDCRQLTPLKLCCNCLITIWYFLSPSAWPCPRPLVTPSPGIASLRPFVRAHCAAPADRARRLAAPPVCTAAHYATSTNVSWLSRLSSHAVTASCPCRRRSLRPIQLKSTPQARQLYRRDLGIFLRKIPLLNLMIEGHGGWLVADGNV